VATGLLQRTATSGVKLSLTVPLHNRRRFWKSTNQSNRKATTSR